MLELVKEFNLSTYFSRRAMDGLAVHFEGEEFRVGLKMSLWDWTLPSFWNSAPWFGAKKCMKEFAAKAREMPDVEFPFELPSSWLELDNKTFYQWVRENTKSERDAKLCETIMRAVHPRPPMAADESLLDRLWNE